LSKGGRWPDGYLQTPGPASTGLLILKNEKYGELGKMGHFFVDEKPTTWYKWYKY
jgi:hypothetical protein